MSLTITSVSRSTQDRMLAAIEASQATTTRAFGTVTGVVAKAMPERLPSLSSVPGASLLPSPHETVELTWGFAEQLVERQRSFVDGLVDASSPAPAPEPKSKS